MVKDINDVIKTLPAARQRKIAARAKALIKTYKDTCHGCGKEFKSFSLGTLHSTVYLNYIKKTKFQNHHHFTFCSKCAKSLIQLMIIVAKSEFPIVIKQLRSELTKKRKSV